MESSSSYAFQQHYEKALECLNSALLCEELGNADRAILLYRLSRRHLLVGLEMSRPGCDQLRMNETLGTVTSRLVTLETRSIPMTSVYSKPVLSNHRHQPETRSSTRSRISAPGGSLALLGSPVMAVTLPFELPPAYTPQPTDGHLSLSHGGKSPDHRRGLVPVSLGEAAVERMFLPGGVQMFFVSSEGRVSTPSYSGFLRIVSGLDPGGADRAPAYLQVSDWIYPLYPDSPVLLSNRGVFTFPDTSAALPGSYVGLVLPPADRAPLQDQLSVLAHLRVQADDGVVGTDGHEKVPLRYSDTSLSPTEDGKALPQWSEKMSHGILAGTSWLGRGLVRGAQATGKVIQNGATRLRENLTPEETPAEVEPRVSRGLTAAKQATSGAVKVSKFLVDGVAAVAGKVGKELAPHVKRHGSKLVPESLKTNQDNRSKLDGAKHVAGSSLQGLSTLWSSLETAGKTIGKSISSETVTTVKHKFRGLGIHSDASDMYGQQAGDAADSVLQSAVNVGVVAFNVENLPAKSLLKAVNNETESLRMSQREKTLGNEKRRNGDDERKPQ